MISWNRKLGINQIWFLHNNWSARLTSLISFFHIDRCGPLDTNQRTISIPTFFGLIHFTVIVFIKLPCVLVGLNSALISLFLRNLTIFTETLRSARAFVCWYPRKKILMLWWSFSRKCFSNNLNSRGRKSEDLNKLRISQLNNTNGVPTGKANNFEVSAWWFSEKICRHYLMDLVWIAFHRRDFRL